MTNKTIFQKIIDKEIPSTIIFEDDFCIAIEDIAPAAPIHILLIPKILINKISDSNIDHQDLLGHLLLKVGDISRLLNIEDSFNVIINNGEKAGMTVPDLHLHIISGKKLSFTS